MKESKENAKINDSVIVTGHLALPKICGLLLKFMGFY
jgi:hypothetical protein